MKALFFSALVTVVATSACSREQTSSVLDVGQKSVFDEIAGSWVNDNPPCDGFSFLGFKVANLGTTHYSGSYSSFRSTFKSQLLRIVSKDGTPVCARELLSDSDAEVLTPMEIVHDEIRADGSRLFVFKRPGKDQGGFLELSRTMTFRSSLMTTVYAPTCGIFFAKLGVPYDFKGKTCLLDPFFNAKSNPKDDEVSFQARELSPDKSRMKAALRGPTIEEALENLKSGTNVAVLVRTK